MPKVITVYSLENMLTVFYKRKDYFTCRQRHWSGKGWIRSELTSDYGSRVYVGSTLVYLYTSLFSLFYVLNEMKLYVCSIHRWLRHHNRVYRPWETYNQYHQWELLKVGLKVFLHTFKTFVRFRLFLFYYETTSIRELYTRR